MPKILAALAILFATTAAAQSTMTWNVAGLQRQALVYAPSARTAHPPLVFAFHGHGGNARTATTHMGIQALWPEAVVVYPQGLPTPSAVDPQGRVPGWQHEPGELGDRDLKFVDVMLASMRQRFSIDGDRVYATGFSNGAMFSYLLWAQRGSAFAAFAICTGVLYQGVPLPAVPRAVLHIAGEADPLVAIDKQLATIEEMRRIDHAMARNRLRLRMHEVSLHDENAGHEGRARRRTRLHTHRAKLTVEFFKQQRRH